MNRILVNATQGDELRVALVRNHTLYDLVYERAGSASKRANIYKGKITSIEKSLNAAFVNFGSERHGFLPLKEVTSQYFLKQPADESERPTIDQVLEVGQEIKIQVEKDERGTKGAALTTLVSLAGSYLVLMPTNPRAGGVSRRVEGKEREELREILGQLTLPEGMGVIIRTAGVGKSREELQWDLDALLKQWEAINKAAEERAAPFLIHQERDIVTRTIRDYLRHDVNEIVIDNAQLFDQAKEYISKVRPDFLDRLVRYEGNIPLFSNYKIEHQIESAFLREVRLPSGGSIVFGHTEALVTIDINSSRATKGGDIEETALNTNIEACNEISRQLRLRDIGGLVVIDFIDMTPLANQRQVEDHLQKALSVDRARIQIGRISRFGLLEMSRQRLRSSLRESIQTACPRCNGQGTIRGIESLSLSIIRMVEEAAMKENIKQVQVQAPVDIATFILNEQRRNIEDIERNLDVTVLIIPNPHMLSPHYKIRPMRHDDRRHTRSYKLMDQPDLDIPHKANTPPSKIEQPAVKATLPSTPAPKSSKAGKPGLFKKLLTSMFGQEEEEKPARRKPSSRSGGRPQRRPQGGGRGRGRRPPQGRGGRRPNPRGSSRPYSRGPRSDAPSQDRPSDTTRPSDTSKSENKNPEKENTD